MRLFSRFAGVCLVVLAGCGGAVGGADDDDGGGADAGPDGITEPIPGGGVGGGPINGSLTVFAIDGDDQPVAGATVTVGGMEQVTDSAGRAVLADAALVGPQTVHVQAAGFAGATWVGVAARGATIPLERSSAASAPYATVSGTLSLPAPGALDGYTIAIVLYSWTPEWGAPDNSIAQPMSGDTPANVCVRSSLDGASCAWSLRARVGQQTIYAVIAEGDTNGTIDDVSDDSYELLGYVARTGVQLSSGQTVTGQQLDAVNDLVALNVAVPAGTGGLADPVALPALDLGADGRMVLPLPILRPGAGATMVPAASGAFAGATHDVLGLATPGFGSTQTHPSSTTFHRDVAPGAVALPGWLPPPTGLGGSGASYSFAPSAGASLHVATLAGATDAPVWTVAILDGSTSFELPQVVAAAQLRVTAVDLPGFVASDFQLTRFDDEVARISEAAIDL